MVEENFEIYWTQKAKNALKLSTMVGEGIGMQLAKGFSQRLFVKFSGALSNFIVIQGFFQWLIPFLGFSGFSSPPYKDDINDPPWLENILSYVLPLN